MLVYINITVQGHHRPPPVPLHYLPYTYIIARELAIGHATWAQGARVVPRASWAATFWSIRHYAGQFATLWSFRTHIHGRRPLQRAGQGH